MTTYLEWDDNEFPLAYFITFRTHGTWLHGEQRGSVDRHARNIYGTERIGLDPVFSVTMDRSIGSEPVLLNGLQRATVESAIRDVCAKRGYRVIAINVRTNHVHVVVAGGAQPKLVMSAFKANATRHFDRRVWSSLIYRYGLVEEVRGTCGSSLTLIMPLNIRSTDGATIYRSFSIRLRTGHTRYHAWSAKGGNPSSSEGAA